MHRETCVKGFSGTTAPKILKFGTNIGCHYLDCVRQNQQSPAYHSLCIDLSFPLIIFFVKDSSETTAPRILKFCTNIGYELLYE